MSPNARRALNWILSLALSALVGALVGSHGFYLSSMVSPYFAAALAGAAIIYACIRPAREFLYVLGVTLVWWVIEFGVAGTRATGIFLVVPTVSLIGLSAFLILGLRSIWSHGVEQRMALYAFVPAVIFAGSDWFASALLALTEKLHPQVYDFFLYSFDASLVWQPGAELGRLFAMHPWFRISCLIVYVGLAIPIALVYGLNLRKNGRAALPVMYAFLLTGPVGVIFYNLLPAMGPAHAFGTAFPFSLPGYAQAAHLVPGPIALPGPRNAIPSLHMSWVLLAWWNSKGLSLAARLVVFYFVVFTVFATLGTGEHYLVDLIVAYPFALFLQALCKTTLPISDRRRLLPLAASLLTILLWFSLLLFAYQVFWLSPILSWAAAIATIAGAIALHRWMNLAAFRVPEANPALTRVVAE